MSDVSRRSFLDQTLRAGVALSAGVLPAKSAFCMDSPSNEGEPHQSNGSKSHSHDIVVYGATSAGVMAAIAAALEGKSVALVEPGRHVGGMVTGGLSHSDVLNQQRVIGGLTKQFFERVGKHYGKPVVWDLEPKVAQQVFNDWLKEAGVNLYLEQPLTSVEKKGASVARLHTANASFSAKVFLDCSYEGELMKGAGVRYVVGREGRDKYGESLAGRREMLPGHHQAVVAVPAFGHNKKLPPYVVRQDTLAALGAGDGKFQAYCFRLCLTSDPDNRLPLPRPEAYDRERYALVRNYLESGGKQLKLRNFMCLGKLPNRKADINSCGFVSTNLLGAQWEYPEATPARRKEIWNEHLQWAQGLVYFLANDPAAPESIRQEMLQWGLPKDEFLDTDHWPHQLYIREGRRMLGEYILTQRDLQEQRQKPDSIGMGGYQIDIREVEWVACDIWRYPDVRVEVLHEGNFSLPIKPYEIPYRSLLPRQAECDNLLVLMCASMSTVAYASYRMEPNYMLAGHSAAVAAALAIDTNRPVHKVAIDVLQKKLRRQGQILSEPAPSEPEGDRKEDC